MRADWTTPDDVRTQIERCWTTGQLLRARVQGESLFPRELHLRRPSRRDLTERFDEVRTWIKQLDESSNARRGFGYEIQWNTLNHRQLGRNRMPSRLLVPSEEDALAVIGKTEEACIFSGLVEQSTRLFPQLQNWIAARPLTVIENAADWERILCVLAWFRDNPRSGRYLRQISLPGIDSKFIESRRGLLQELLAALFPDELREASGMSFEQRFGLVSKPPLVRFRFLDERLYLGGFSDLAVPASDFARSTPDVQWIFITENEINGLTFPQFDRAVVIFGLGYGLERLSEAIWLRSCDLFYWGDIDTHGFAMLDRLRAAFPNAHSFLMDRNTLLQHSEFWVTEPEQFTSHLGRLTSSESSVYSDLVQNKLGDRVRLEQERISFSAVEAALFRLRHS